MLKTITNILKNKEVLNRIIFTLGVLLVFRLGAAITVPRIDAVMLMAGAGDNSLLAIMNMLGGGHLQRFSIFALGVGPYITASIVIQMLSMDVVPYLTELTKSGDTGKKQIDKITRYLTAILAFIQAYTMTWAFDTSYGIVQDPSVVTYAYVAVILTAGTMFLCWLGDRISLKGIGNGMSMLIFAGIVSNIPAQFTMVYNTILSANAENRGLGIGLFVGYIVIYFVMVILVIYMTQAVRKIPIQYTSSSVQRGKNDMTFIPLKINSANVIPVIFASAMMTAPMTIASFFPRNAVTAFIDNTLNFQRPIGLAIYLVLIVMFTFFYTNLQVDPEKMSDNLNRNGSYIVGIRPGADTKNYIATILNRITVLGALGLAFIAALPPLLTIIFPVLPGIAALFGTGIIIVIGVALETAKDVHSRLAKRDYHGFVKK